MLLVVRAAEGKTGLWERRSEFKLGIFGITYYGIRIVKYWKEVPGKESQHFFPVFNYSYSLIGDPKYSALFDIWLLDRFSLSIHA